MNSRDESLYLSDDLAVQRARKLQDFGIIENALRQSSNYIEFSQILREKNTELERNVE